MKKKGRVISFVLTLGLTVGQAVGWPLAQAQSETKPVVNQDPPTKQQPITKVAPTQALGDDYIIGPEDLLEIRVFEQQDLSGEARVSSSGFIRILPFPEPLKVAGLTENQVADLIREKLTALFRNPQVVVRVKESRSRYVAVIGAVRTPNRYELVRGMKLLDLLAAAGGLTESAGNVVHIIRNGGVAPSELLNRPEEAAPTLEEIDLRQLKAGQVDLVNKPIQPRDIISVPEADQIFVTGNVTNPNGFKLRGDMTLTKAIALAGGVRPQSLKNKVTILRRLPGQSERTEIPVDLEKIEKDHSKDPTLEANDVVFVPSSSTRNIGMAMLNAFSLGAAGQLIWLLR
jgi:polysaccharide export outer membrane protein